MDMNLYRDKFFLTQDPNSGYTMDDFLKEFDSLPIATPDNRLEFRFKNESNNPDPEYASTEAAGIDLRANIVPVDNGYGGKINSITLKAGEWGIIPTGLFFDIPQGFEIQIRSRSGLAAKYAVVVLNGVGTIDSDYIGEIKVILINHGKEDFIINHGERIAQAVISTATSKRNINLVRVNEITKETERGSGGFGSTGLGVISSGVK